jgi:hypothetical protein
MLLMLISCLGVNAHLKCYSCWVCLIAYDFVMLCFQAIAETQLLRVTSMSTGLLLVFVDSAKNLPVSYSCFSRI